MRAARPLPWFGRGAERVGGPLPAGAGLGANDKRGVVGKLASEALTAREVWRPTGVVELCQPEVIQTSRSYTGPAELAGNGIASVVELSADRPLPKSQVIDRDRAGSWCTKHS